MKIRGDSLLYIVIAVIMLVIIGSSLVMEHFESKLLPLVIASIVFALAVIGLWRHILAGVGRGVTATEGGTGAREKAGEGWRGYLLNGAWIGGFSLGIFLVGFFVAIPLFILFYMKWLGTRWSVAIIFAVLTPVLLYGVFERALEVDLYGGLLFSWLGY